MRLTRADRERLATLVALFERGRELLGELRHVRLAQCDIMRVLLDRGVRPLDLARAVAPVVLGRPASVADLVRVRARLRKRLERDRARGADELPST